MADKQRARRKPSEGSGRSRKAKPLARRLPRAIVLAPTRGSSHASPGRRARAVGRAVDTVPVTFGLQNVHGDLVYDPEGIFTFRRRQDGRQIADQARLALRGAEVRFDIPAGGDVVQCDIDLQRYRFTRSPLFIRAVGFPRTFEGPLLREPDEWRPTFTRWVDLPAEFAHLQTVLSASTDIALLGTERSVASLAGAAYDAVIDDDVVLAKTALLNLFYRLRTAGPPIVGADPWFSFVTEIVGVDRERFVAWVQPAMAEIVRDICANVKEWGDEFEKADPRLHRKNVPKDLQSRVVDMLSIKSTHDKGNYQLTLIELTGSEVLLDADIDESGTFWGHALDLFKHKRTGGTHPVDVHEILVRQEGREPGFDLGYTLV